jgi:hypothetical protein
LVCYESRQRPVPRRSFRGFYASRPDAPSRKDQENDITRSMERLIDRGLLSGYGKRTPAKWFIESVSLTPAGRRLAKRLRGEQQSLPLPKSFRRNP